ncbi:4-hydroxy-3-methylbut-2-enyl diphosphate reductase, chloroplastic [Capsicum baccatum]|uniref:4-hydroxy-3-methylbut-2-enyl diphosphate reductase, chloroplastic n=1 Tax=Capsicum baccatum TaxID=33114 RepID=A0A2G2W0B0_CAPBA|nr:4-hydroxy-3-methylbut-2-enyl diphosphate reductase, chloroplastic [Capsicum baccatum]
MPTSGCVASSSQQNNNSTQHTFLSTGCSNPKTNDKKSVGASRSKNKSVGFELHVASSMTTVSDTEGDESEEDDQPTIKPRRISEEKTRLEAQKATYVYDYIIGGKIDGSRSTKDAFMQKFIYAVFDGFDPDVDLVKVGIANQTAMLKGETEDIEKLAEKTMMQRFGVENINNHFVSFNTICDATQDDSSIRTLQSILSSQFRVLQLFAIDEGTDAESEEEDNNEPVPSDYDSEELEFFRKKKHREVNDQLDMFLELEKGIPCAHAIKDYSHDKQEPKDHVNWWYSKEAYMLVSMHKIQPIRGSKFLKVDPAHAMEPPEIQNMIGRPKVMRKRKNAESRKRYNLLESLDDMKVKNIPLQEGKKKFDVVDKGDVVVLPIFVAAVDEILVLSDKKVQIIDTHCPWVTKETYISDYILGGKLDGSISTKEAFIQKFIYAVFEGFDPDVDLVKVGIANQTTMLKGEIEDIG